MTKGPGRSDCCRIGVTYGYRECLRKGPGQASSAVYLPTGYGESIDGVLMCAEIDPKHLQLFQSALSSSPSVSSCFLVTVYREIFD